MRAKYGLEGILSAIIFIVLFGVILIQVAGRTPLFSGYVWTEELARWLWVWMVFIGIAEVERTGGQLKMDLFAGFISPNARRWLAVAIDTVFFAVLVHLSWIGWKTIRRTWHNETVTLPTTDALLYASAFLASFLILFRVGMRIRRLAMERHGAEMSE